jgi:hypothetical protein
MLRIHYMQQWFGLSDPAMEEALHDVPLYREFAKLEGITARLPDARRDHHPAIPPPAGAAQPGGRYAACGERHPAAQAKGMLMRTGTVVGATLICAPSSTKNNHHAVRLVQPVDGARATSGSAGMSAPVMRQRRVVRRRIAQRRASSVGLHAVPLFLSLMVISSCRCRCKSRCADLPTFLHARGLRAGNAAMSDGAGAG